MSTTIQKVPMGQKIAFGFGMLANQMFPAALGVFIIVLVQDLGFAAILWGLLQFAPRIFDAITDPIMGFISDNTRSKWGRRRQYVFIGGLVMGIAYVAMWQLYKDNGVTFNFIYFFLWSLVFYLGLTIFSVPYVAIGYEMSDDFKERTKIMAIAQWIGQWAWVIAPWFWVFLYDPNWFPSGADAGVRELSIYVAIPCTLFALIPAIFIKSKSTLDRDDFLPITFKYVKNSLSSIFKDALDAFKIKQFRQIAFSTFLVFNSFNVIAAFTPLIIWHHMFNSDQAAAGIWPSMHGSVGALATTFLVIPLVTLMANKLGKKKTFIISQLISIIGYIMFWFLFVEGKPHLFLFALPFQSFGIGGLFTIMMSMTADVCDIDELNTGKRREGVLGAVYWWMVKMGFAVAALLGGIILAVVGFDADNVTTSSVTGIRLFYSLFPIAGVLGAIFIMKNYDLTEERANEIRAELDRRKNPPKKRSSYHKTGLLSSLTGTTIKNTSQTGLDLNTLNTAELNRLFAKTLKNGIHGLCFSPYTEGQTIGDTLSEAQIKQRMEVIAPYTTWIRSFSCTDGNELIPKIAHQKGLKTMAGAWISNDHARNKKEMNALIKLGKQGHVNIAVVGNEAIMREDVHVQEIINYIETLKKELPGVPVGYVDAYYQYHNHPELVEACDLVLVNCYPFWEGCHINQADLYLQQMYAVTQKIAQGKPVIITETGWPNQGGNTDKATPSKENAMKYYIDTANWSQKEDIPIFYFSSFDESWKIKHEGDVGARWGLWDKNEKLKY